MYYPATMLAALFGGMAAGLLATTVSAALVFFWILRGAMHYSESVAMLGFVSCCLLLSFAVRAMRQAQERATQATEIYERQRAEEKIRVSEQSYRSLFEHMNEGIAYCRMIDEPGQPKDFVYLEVNSKFTTLTGLKDVAGKLATEVIPGIRETDPEFFEIYGRVAATGKPERFERFVESLQMWFDISAYCPKPGFFVAVFDVITERKRAELALHQSELLLRQVIDLVPLHIFAKDRHGRFLFLNRAAADACGYQPQEMIGRLERELEPDQPFVEKFLRDDLEVIASGQPKFIPEESYTSADGSVHFLQTTKMPFTPPGSAEQGVLGVAVDITERKEQEKALRASEARFQQITAGIEDVLYGVNSEDGEFNYLSPVFERMLGYTLDDVVRLGGREKFLAGVIQGGEFEKQCGLFRKLQLGPTNITPRWQSWWRCKDGSLKYIEDFSLPVYFEGGLQCIYGVLRDITERNKKEKTLYASEARYRQLHETMRDAFGIVDMDGRLQECNRAFQEMLGYSEAELKQLSYMGLTPAKWHELDARMVREQILPRGYSEVYEKEYRRKDGSVFPINLRVTLIRNDAGQATGMWAVIRDITKRKRAEAELHESESKYRNLFECSRDALLRLDPVSRRFTSVNPSAVRMFGAKNEAELIGHGPEEFSPERQPDGRLSAEVAKEIDEIVLREGSHFFEWTHRRISGDEFQADVLLTRIEVDDLPIILATVRDITERKRVQESHDRLVMAVEQAAETIVITDTGGTILYVNPAFEQTTGYTRAEALGQNPRLFKSGRHDAAFYRRMWETLEHGETWSGHFFNKRKDGTLYEEEATLSPVRDAAGKVVNYVAVKRDVTHEMELEAQIRQVQKMEAIGQLAGGVAHDFNNILAIISMQASLLKGGGGLSAAQLSFAEEIGTTVDRAAALTRQLLLFSRREAPQLRDLDWSEAVTDTTKMLRRILGETIKVQLNLAAEPMFIHADAGMMDQLLMNLAVNARDAMPAGGRLVIETTGVQLDEFSAAQSAQARPGSFVCLSVGDSGGGIPPEVLPRIFEPFFTTKDVGQGTGLGLATVFGIVQQHKGWIDVHTEAGQGTTFKIYLPRLVGMSDKLIAQKLLATVPTGKETILLVEDETPLRASVNLTLTHLGYRVLEAATGNQALKIWQKKRDNISLLLTDLVMPDGLNGKDLAQRLLQDKPELKVIYMSGYSAEVVGRDFPLAEDVNFLTKPFPAHKLARIIRDSLDKSA